MESFVLLLLNAYSTFLNSLIQTETNENYNAFQNINLKKVPDLLIMFYENESIKQSGLKNLYELTCFTFFKMKF